MLTKGFLPVGPGFEASPGSRASRLSTPGPGVEGHPGGRGGLTGDAAHPDDPIEPIRELLTDHVTCQSQ